MSELINSIESSYFYIKELYKFEEKTVTEHTDEEIRKALEHTNLKPTATPKEIELLCNEAKDYQLRSVCINPSYISYAKHILDGTGVLVVTVIGFPLGANSTAIKVEETSKAIKDGADEVDMVIHQGRLKAKDYEYVYYDINKIVKTAGKIPVKVIIETANLTYEEKIAASIISKLAGACFIKTSTGFAASGATIEDVHLMSFIAGSQLQVKASGGVRDRKAANEMLSYGATLIGTSNSINILTNKNNAGTSY